jgi:3-phenylpropionate/trans-cinnamate dioxygenase ferredoxin subunit
MSGVVVCKFDDLAPNSSSAFVVNGKRVAIIRIGDDVYAVSDTCSHADLSLSEGEVWAEDKTIECWRHGSRFDLLTGEPITLPATVPIPVFVASVVDGNVVVDVELDGAAKS